ncbi:hypothetical protein RUND412_000034 [Rhizina undulata]
MANFLPSRMILSYTFDYVVIVVFILGFLSLDLIDPYNQPFSLENKSLQYPMANPERIPAKWAAVIAVAFPLLVIIIWTMLIDGLFSHHKTPVNRRRMMGGGGWTMRERLWQMNCGILGLGLSVACAIVITGALKNTTGKPRPDIIARCQPKTGSVDASPYGLSIASEICTQTDAAIMRDGFKSFPSGHSSTAFSGLGFLSFWLAGKLHLMDSRGEVWKTIVVMIPLLSAALVAVSRIMDARHHPFDVISGSLLGFFVAWASYRQYFPSLNEPWKKGRAYPARTWGTSSTERRKHLEEGDEAAGGLVAGAEEEGKAGLTTSASGMVVPMPGVIERSNTAQTSRFHEESEALQARKREAERNAGRGTGQDGYFGDEDQDYANSSEEGYELRPTVAPLRVNQQYQAYQTQPYAEPNQGEEDARWGIAKSGTAVSGGGAGNSSGLRPALQDFMMWMWAKQSPVAQQALKLHQSEPRRPVHGIFETPKGLWNSYEN